MSGSAKCTKCGAPIFWADSEKRGKPMPMDAEPVPEGRYVLDEQGAGKNPKAIFAHSPLTQELHHYNCHFDTCRVKPAKGVR